MIKRERENVTIVSFRGEFRNSDYALEAIEMAYEDITTNRHHPIRRYDKIQQTLGFVPEEFEDIMLNRCLTIGISEAFSSLVSQF
jgi:hypothetical protein